MKAFVYRLTDDGQALLTGRVSPDYQRFGNFMRHWGSKLPPGRYRAHIYFNWAARYRDADQVTTFTVLPPCHHATTDERDNACH